ncbi:hypothetical protein ABMB67_000150 [Halalkalibacter oceani]
MAIEAGVVESVRTVTLDYQETDGGGGLVIVGQDQC